jgi:hypothetical protein
MELSEKIELNKALRKYDGVNTFILSLKKNLASKYCKKESIDGKEYKVLSEKQYQAAKEALGL